jgi:hypothetical protein
MALSSPSSSCSSVGSFGRGILRLEKAAATVLAILQHGEQYNHVIPVMLAQDVSHVSWQTTL